jgi:hypothetical protein
MLEKYLIFKYNNQRRIKMEKIGKIYKSLQNVNDEINAIAKDKKGYGYKFRGIDDILNVFGPLFKKNKIVTRRKNVKITQILDENQDPNKKQIHFMIEVLYGFISLEDGSEIETLGFASGMDKLDKGLLCAISNSFKYVMFEFFCIPVEGIIDSDMKFAKDNKSELPKKNIIKEDIEDNNKDLPPKRKSSFRKNRA